MRIAIKGPSEPARDAVAEALRAAGYAVTPVETINSRDGEYVDIYWVEFPREVA